MTTTPLPTRAAGTGHELPEYELMAAPPAMAPSSDQAAPLPTGRGVELLLLALAAVLTTGALVLVEANQEQTLTTTLLYLGLAYLVLFAGAHMAVRRWAPYADPLILPAVALLNGLGLVMIHRIDLAKADRAQLLGREIPTAQVTSQVIWTIGGILLFAATLALMRDHRLLARYGYTAGFVGLRAPRHPGRAPELDLGGQRGQAVDPDRRAQLPARRDREDPAHRLLRGLPRAEAQPALHRRPPVPGHGAAARP